MAIPAAEPPPPPVLVLVLVPGVRESAASPRGVAMCGSGVLRPPPCAPCVACARCPGTAGDAVGVAATSGSLAPILLLDRSSSSRCEDAFPSTAKMKDAASSSLIAAFSRRRLRSVHVVHDRRAAMAADASGPAAYVGCGEATCQIGATM